MTSTSGKASAAEGISISLGRRIADWIGARQQAVSDRAHASADAHAVVHGWTVTASTGRFRFGARTYRDPRFDSRPSQGRPVGPARFAGSPGTASGRSRAVTSTPQRPRRAAR